MDPYISDLTHQYVDELPLSLPAWFRAIVERAYYQGWIKGFEDKESETDPRKSYPGPVRLDA